MTTKGEYRVGIAFNPSADSMVDKIKRAAADLIDLVETIDGDGERARLKALAQTEIESAAMWAVKATTKPPADGIETPPPTDGNPDDLFDEIVRGALRDSETKADLDLRMDTAIIDAAKERLRKAGFVAVSEEDIRNALFAIRQAGG